MRILSALLLLWSLSSSAQTDHSENWHSGVGVSFSTLNFKQNGAGALAIPYRYDFLTSGKSTLSLGTNLQFGSEDEYGISFPIIALVVLFTNSSTQHDLFTHFFDNGATSNSDKRYGVGLFTHAPLLLDYNFGLGTKNGDDDKIGFYAGGGMSFTLTGYTVAGGSTIQQSTYFFGWEANAGIRLRNNLDIGFSMVLPFNDPIGPIQHPLLYQLTLCSFKKRR